MKYYFNSLLIFSFFIQLVYAGETPIGIARITSDFMGQTGLCTGTIVGNKLITAAHCFLGTDVTEVHATGLGKIDLKNSKVHIHPGADIAVIELNKTYKTSFELVESAAEMEELSKLPRSERNIWGYSLDDWEDGPQHAKLGGYQEFSERLDFDRPSIIKDGDSGGPSAFKVGKKFKLFGVTHAIYKFKYSYHTIVDDLRVVPIHKHIEWLDNPINFEKMPIGMIRQKTIKSLKKYDYQISPSQKYIDQFTNWYQFLATDILAKNEYQVSKKMPSILRFNNPYQVHLLRSAAFYNIGDMDTLIELLAEVKDEKTMNGVLRAFNRRTVILGEKPGNGRWTRAFIESVKDGVNEKGEAINFETEEEIENRIREEKRIAAKRAAAQRQEELNKFKRSLKQFSHDELIQEYVKDRYIKNDKLRVVIEHILKDSPTRARIDEIMKYARLEKVNGPHSNASIILDSTSDLKGNKTYISHLIGMASEASEFRYYNKTFHELIKQLGNNLDQEGVKEALIKLAKNKEKTGSVVDILKKLSHFKNDLQVNQLLFDILRKPSSFYDNTLKLSMNMLEGRVLEPGVEDKLRRLVALRTKSYSYYSPSEAASKVLERANLNSKPLGRAACLRKALQSLILSTK